MKSKTSRRWYYCRHCNKRFDSFFMADVCYILDMKLLEMKKEEPEIELYKKYCNN